MQCFIFFAFAISLSAQTSDPDYVQKTQAEMLTKNAASIAELRTRAAAGDLQSQVHLGVVLLNGNIAPKDVEEGTKWLRLAGEKETPVGQSLIGYDFASAKNYKEAGLWYLKAASRGNYTSLSPLVRLCGEGKIEKEDCEATKGLLQQYADDEKDVRSVEALIDLSTMYADGRGIPVNLPEAYRLLELAASSAPESLKPSLQKKLSDLAAKM
jgi:uncharacterized protein